jgi:hypothetical protein
MLFRFSALTFNAHLIHLDKEYARDVEGHRNLLVHGPLTVTLMISFMRHYLRKLPDKPQVIESLEYRNLAPLYCDEPMRLCARKRNTSDAQTSYEVWIEGPTGGVAFKGTMHTCPREIDTTESQQTTTADPVPNSCVTSTGADDASPVVPIRKIGVSIPSLLNLREETSVNQSIFQKVGARLVTPKTPPIRKMRPRVHGNPRKAYKLAGLYAAKTQRRDPDSMEEKSKIQESNDTTSNAEKRE